MHFGVAKNSLMPRSPIAAKQNNIIWICLRQFLKKTVHANRIAVRNDKEKGVSGQWFNCAICIPIFTDVMAWYRWPDSFFTPTIFRLVDPAKACFILKHQSDSAFYIVLVYIIFQFPDSCFNFFEVSMTSSVAFFGCRLLGITFRQPCLFST